MEDESSLREGAPHVANMIRLQGIIVYGHPLLAVVDMHYKKLLLEIYNGDSGTKGAECVGVVFGSLYSAAMGILVVEEFKGINNGGALEDMYGPLAERLRGVCKRTHTRPAPSTEKMDLAWEPSPHIRQIIIARIVAAIGFWDGWKQGLDKMPLSKKRNVKS